MNQIHEQQTILIVDDTPQNIDLFTHILSDTYSVKAALNGEKALKIAGADKKPDLILLDIMMPGMNGYEVCRALKADPLTKKIPVIFITAKGHVDDETKGFDLGAADYITKPVSPPIVRARLKTHLDLYDQSRLLEQKVRERTSQLINAFEEIKNASLDTIHRLSMAAEFKDEDTGAHVKRMSNYASIVARKLGLDDTLVESILYAAPMHDIGKIGIPDHILLKPGKLTPEEWEIMKQHTTFGGRILEGSENEFIRLGETIARTHHEKWDGSGYPSGLKGHDIPMEGRIVAIADVFDALTSRRPYKEPFSIEKSFAIIREGRGTQFDPDVVDAFFDSKEEILTIKETYLDEHESPLYELAEHLVMG